jgi:hypothetical protein
MTLSILSMLFILLTGATDVIVPRDGGEEIRGTIVRLDEDGVRLRVRGTDEADITDLMLSWDRIADVRIGGPSQPRLPELMERARQLFHARTRMERGDFANAEPIFELEFPGVIGRDGETALVIADGLVRCRLDRGNLSGALEPGLEYARMRRAGVTATGDGDHMPPTTVRTGSRGVIPMWDDRYGLLPYLPPVWLQGPAFEGAVSQLLDRSATQDAELDIIADLYARSMLLERGLEVESVDTSAEGITGRPGPLLMAHMVNAMHPDSEVRKAARRRLERRVPDEPAWVETWCRFQLGRSYLLEPGAGQRRKGMLQFVHLITESSDAHPYLVGMAMAIMADEFESQGDQPAAARLRADLERAVPGHPVLHTPLTPADATGSSGGKENP